MLKDYGFNIDRKTVSKVVNSVLKTIKEELPKEYQCQCIVNYILSEAQEEVNFIRLEL